MRGFRSSVSILTGHRAAIALALGAWACSDVADVPPGTPGSGGSVATGGASAGVSGSTTSGSGGSATGGSTTNGGTGAVTGGAAGTPASGGTTAQGGSAGSGNLGGSAGVDITGGTGATGETGGSGGGPVGGSGPTGGTSTGGSAGSGTQGGSGGSGTAGTPSGTFGKAAGTIPNGAQPATTTNVPKDQWQRGIISPSMQNGHQINQSSVVNGYLVVGGNEEFWIYDVSNPAMPRQLSSFTTPNRTGGEAETHAISYARYGDKLYAVTIGGRGIDTWDVTNPMMPAHLTQLRVPGVNYGDYTEAIWGVTWQGQYIYVGATNNGIKVVNAADPRALSIVAEVPTSSYGGVSAGPLEAVGNVLVVTTPKESGGIATLDISNPTAPTRLASFTTSTAYIGAFYRRYVFLIGVRAWDVLTNPRSIGSGTSPIGSLTTEGSEYMAFSDDHMFLGHLRGEIGGSPGASKITVENPRSMRVVERIWGRMNLGDKNDDQFVFPFGNLVVIGDDQAPYPGWFIAVHQAAPDTKAPVVDTVIPNNASTANSTKSRIGISFSDNIELATVNSASFIVRPMGGQPLAGKYGLRNGVVNFDPDADLQAGTTYEVVLPAGGVGDLVGNRLAAEFKSTFTTM
ncbi:MAG TPA: Ig-like domain-containing protein [Polyangiaceae bacterium]